MKPTYKNIYQLKLGIVNAYLIDHKELTLIDTGYEGSENKIVEAIRSLGKEIEDLKHIIVTHHHPDHAGSLAKLKELSNATIYMHKLDGQLVEKGTGMRENTVPGPGIILKLVHRFFIKGIDPKIPPVKIDHFVKDGDIIQIGEGYRILNLPGHSKGQIALLYGGYERVLFVADAAMNVVGLTLALVYEDLQQGKKDVERLSQLDFGVAFFGHGHPIHQNASRRFKKKFLR